MLKSQWRTTDRKEAAICRYSTKLVFLKISQNSLENGYVEISLIKNRVHAGPERPGKFIKFA